MDVHSEYLEQHLHRRAREVAPPVARTNPHRSRIQCLEKSNIFDVYCSETVNAALHIEELSMVTEDIEAWVQWSDEAEAALAFPRQQLKATSSGTQYYNTGLPLHEVEEQQ